MISVIVPVYNTEKYLKRCIESVLSQTYADIEVILVDDGSTDRSGWICDQYAAADQRVVVLHKENGGLSDARNAGIQCARGEYLSFVDSDDFIHTDFLRVLYENLVYFEADISMCSFWWIGEEEAVPQGNTAHEALCFTHDSAVRLLYENKFDEAVEIVVAWNKLYKASLFDRVRYPVGRLHEDEFVIHRLLHQCKKLAYSSRKLYYYIRHGESITGMLSGRRVKDIADAFGERAEFWEQAGEKELFVRAGRYWALELKELYVRSGTSRFEGYADVQKWIRRKLRDGLPGMRRKGLLNGSEYLCYRIWSYHPALGEAVQAGMRKIKSFSERCVGKVRACCGKMRKRH